MSLLVLTFLSISLPEGVQIALIAGLLSVFGTFSVKLYDQRYRKRQQEVDGSATVRTKEIDDAASTRAELWAEIRSLRGRQSEFSTAQEALVRENANLAAEVRVLGQQVQHLSIQLADTVHERDVLQLRVQDLERENAKLRQVAATLQTQIEKLTSAQSHYTKGDSE